MGIPPNITMQDLQLLQAVKMQQPAMAMMPATMPNLGYPGMGGMMQGSMGAIPGSMGAIPGSMGQIPEQIPGSMMQLPGAMTPPMTPTMGMPGMSSSPYGF